MPQHRFTIYDALDKAGLFEANTANINARGPNGEATYQGPVKFPAMLYHPQGEEIVTVPGEMINTPFGPKHVGLQKELITRLVQNQEELDAALAEGWHDHPIDATRARIKLGIAAGTHTELDLKKLPIKPKSQETIAEMEAELAKLRAEKAEQQAKAAPAPATAAPAKTATA